MCIKYTLIDVNVLNSAPHSSQRKTSSSGNGLAFFDWVGTKDTGAFKLKPTVALMGNSWGLLVMVLILLCLNPLS